MRIRDWLRPPRRTLTLFVAMAAALAAALGVAAWWFVALDRDVETQRVQTRLESDVDLVAVSLQNWLNEIDLKLASFQKDDPASWSWVGPSSVVVAITASSTEAWPPGRLAFLPDDANAGRDPKATGHALALITEAARLRDQGRASASLAVYDRLRSVDARILNDTPAELVAREARLSVLGDLGRSNEAVQEARSLLEALRTKPWRLSAGQYLFYAGKAADWLSDLPANAAFPNQREATSLLVSQLESDGWPPSPKAPRRIVWIDRHAYVVVTRAGPNGTTVFIGGAADLEAVVRQRLRFSNANLTLALTDDAGRVVMGHLPAPAGRIIRTGAEAGLPWWIHAAPGRNEDVAAATRRITILGGALVVGFVVLAGGWSTARAMHRELEVARVQADFVSAVSHEFRTPVAAFEQLSELLMDGRVASEDDRSEYYRRLHRESRRLRRLVEDLLDFRRMEAGASEFRFEPVDLADVVNTVVDEFQEERGARIQLVAGNEPALEPVRADRQALGRALWNLLDNAAKYAPGSPITVGFATDGDRVRITVRDCGPGVPRGRHEDIFRRFVRANGPEASAVPGTGLGLAMVREIAEAHGGRAAVDNPPGGGAVFTIEIPR